MSEHFTRAIVLKHRKNNEKATRLKTSAIWSVLANLNSPFSPKLPDKDALST